MYKSVVISGEASETDSEDEIKFTHNPVTQTVVGSVITGEDSESENEHETSIDSAVSALNIIDDTTTSTENQEKFDGLLQQKLRECNVKLHDDLQNYCQSIIDEASRNLNAIDQDLLRSQITLQSAVTSLKSLTANSMTLKNKLHSLLTARFISNVNVDE